MELDKFYTSQEVAKECISLIPNIEQYDLIIEPSAGDGAFSHQLSCIAYDIAPEADDIIQQDWLEVEPIKDKKILVVGNPPFGNRSSLAKAFIKQAQKIGAETIAFILPDVFSKLSNQSLSLFSKEWKLICEYKLEGQKSYFTTQDGDYKVPCSFYIWTKQDVSFNLRKIKLPQTKDFVFLPRSSAEADFTINGNSGKVKQLIEITNPKAEHYIKAGARSKEELIDIFSSINYNFKSSVNGGNAWIGQQEILEAYYSYISSCG
jgi:hypothetical protein